MLTMYSGNIIYIRTLFLVTQLEYTSQSPLKFETTTWQSYKQDKFKGRAVFTSWLSTEHHMNSNADWIMPQRMREIQLQGGESLASGRCNPKPLKSALIYVNLK